MMSLLFAPQGTWVRRLSMSCNRSSPVNTLFWSDMAGFCLLGLPPAVLFFCDSDCINSTHKDRQPYRTWMDAGISSTYEWLQYLWDTLQINKTLVLSAEWLNWALKWPTNHPWVNAVKVLWPQHHGRVCQRKNTYFLTYLKFMFNHNVKSSRKGFALYVTLFYI